jgi:hypothetical protein
MSFKIDCDWFDQPGSSDPMEQKTWAGIRIEAGTRTVTRIWDRVAKGQRLSIFIPAYPLAHWIVRNWWSLFFEPRAAEEVNGIHRQGWTQRHHMRSASSDILLPNLRIYSDGCHIFLEWDADSSEQYPNMPGYFLDYGREVFDPSFVEEAFRTFVKSVIERLRGVDDIRALELSANWEAIASGDKAEMALCRAAGRLGLDPYDVEAWPIGLLELIESVVPNDIVADSVFDDLIESTPPESVLPAWEWVKNVGESYQLGSIASHQLGGLDRRVRAALIGYQEAQKIRGDIACGEDSPLDHLEQITDQFSLGRMDFIDRNHLPYSGVRAEVGSSKTKGLLLIGPAPAREESLRFLKARGLFQMFFGCALGPRLITDTHVWNQQASRAFAAELLAPRTGVREFFQKRIVLGDSPDDAIQTIAKHYRVQERLVENQLRNVQ